MARYKAVRLVFWNNAWMGIWKALETVNTTAIRIIFHAYGVAARSGRSARTSRLSFSAIHDAPSILFGLRIITERKEDRICW